MHLSKSDDYDSSLLLFSNSSVGRILKSSGVRVTSIKIDPYLNVDAGMANLSNFTLYLHHLLVVVSATYNLNIFYYSLQRSGTMSPFEHGETFVLDDGGETDLDLGNYER